VPRPACAGRQRKAQSPMRSFANELTKISATMAKADRVAELLAADDMLPEPPNAYRGGRATGDVVLEDVSFGYGAERPVLSGVSLRVASVATLVETLPNRLRRSEFRLAPTMMWSAWFAVANSRMAFAGSMASST